MIAHRENILKQISKIVVDNDLYIVPLHRINEKTNRCTCGNDFCTSKGKHPFFRKNWKQVASRDSKTVSRWLSEFNQSYNFGVLTGRTSQSNNNKRLVIVDVDKITENNQAFIDMLPKQTVHYQTGSGGYHYWYWTEEPVSNSVSKFAEFVDIRGMNGYAVIPPSNHKSGRLYGQDLFTFDYPICDFPKELLEVRKKSANQVVVALPGGGPTSTINRTKIEPGSIYAFWIKKPVKEIRAALYESKNIPLGIRNSTIHRLLSSDRSKGMEQDKLQNQAEFYRSCCEQPNTLSQVELSAMVQSVLRYPNYANLQEEKEINQDFFSLLKTETNPYKYQPLTSIIDKYNEFHVSNKLTYIAITKQQFSKKLLEMGYVKKHTKTGNVWNVKIV